MVLKTFKNLLLLILKLGMQHWGLKLYKFYINDNPGLSLAYFTESGPYPSELGEINWLHGTMSVWVEALRPSQQFFSYVGMFSRV